MSSITHSPRVSPSERMTKPAPTPPAIPCLTCYECTLRDPSAPLSLYFRTRKHDKPCAYHANEARRKTARLARWAARGISSDHYPLDFADDLLAMAARERWDTAKLRRMWSMLNSATTKRDNLNHRNAWIIVARRTLAARIWGACEGSIPSLWVGQGVCNGSTR